MVYYSLDDEVRLRVYFALAVVSIAISYGVNTLSSLADYRFLVAPSVLMVFGFVVSLFNGFLWQIWGIRWLSKIPYLHGTWSGTLTKIDPDNGSETAHDVTMTITQTWQKIDFVLESVDTRSHAKVVHMATENHQKITVEFLYAVEPTIGNRENRYSEGYNKLLLSENGGLPTLSGPYFASKLRRGHLSVTKN